MKPIKIGNIKLVNPLILAPMLEVTNLPFRILCRKQGAALAFTEMIYTSAILHENKATKEMMKTSKEDSPLGVQVTGHCVEEFKEIVPYLGNYKLIDLNCGCPSVRLIDSKAGSYLLNSPDKIAQIIKILKTANLPVTVKVRLGFKKNNLLNIAKTIEKAGADTLTIHPRLATQPYSIPADWNEIKKVKPYIGIPIIGNGDITSPQKAQEMLEIADGAMFGRAAIGNPLIFKQTLQYLKTGKYPLAKPKKNIKLLKQYLSLCKKHNSLDIRRIKLASTNFIKSFDGAAKIRLQLSQLKTLEEISEFVKQIII